MGSPRYTQDELKKMRAIMLQDPIFGSPEYDSFEKPQLVHYEAVKLPQVEVEAVFAGSLSFTEEQQEKIAKGEPLAPVTILEEKIETIIKQPALDKLEIIAVPDLGGKILNSLENLGKATEETFDAALDLFKMILGKEKSKKVKEKDPQKAQEEALMNRQNIATVEQAIKDAKAINQARAQKDFQRVAGDEVAVMSDEAKKKVLNLQTGLERKFTTKDAADLRNALIEQKKQQEQQKAAMEIKAASKGPNLNKNLANEQGVHSIYNTAG